MKTKVLLISILALAGCKKPAPVKYTVQGNVSNGTTGQSFFNQPFQLAVVKTTSPSKTAILASGSTDAKGNFSVTYEQTDITDYNAQINILSQFFIVNGLPVNQNINRNFYFSTLGKLKINLKPKAPLAQGDSLFIGYTVQDASQTRFQIDTLISTFSGAYKQIRVPVPYINIFWGHGSVNFVYLPDRNGFKKVEASAEASITGDPIIDSITVNY